MTADYKRGSKFALPDKATLLSFSAYLDGAGGATGSQSVRMVLYRDSGGLPAARIAQSNTVTVADGAANWYGNPDTFADGAANPFGAGTAGTGTLSVNVSYTVGY